MGLYQLQRNAGTRCWVPTMATLPSTNGPLVQAAGPDVVGGVFVFVASSGSGLFGEIKMSDREKGENGFEAFGQCNAPLIAKDNRNRSVARGRKVRRARWCQRRLGGGARRRPKQRSVTSRSLMPRRS